MATNTIINASVNEVESMRRMHIDQLIIDMRNELGADENECFIWTANEGKYFVKINEDGQSCTIGAVDIFGDSFIEGIDAEINTATMEIFVVDNLVVQEPASVYSKDQQVQHIIETMYNNIMKNSKREVLDVPTAEEYDALEPIDYTMLTGVAIDPLSDTAPELEKQLEELAAQFKAEDEAKAAAEAAKPRLAKITADQDHCITEDGQATGMTQSEGSKLGYKLYWVTIAKPDPTRAAGKRRDCHFRTWIMAKRPAHIKAFMDQIYPGQDIKCEKCY